jgi:hypothetical protein
VVPSYCSVPEGLTRGATGDGVRHLQEWLTHHGYALKVDGDFGPATERALFAFSGRKDVSPQVARDLVAPMQRALDARGSLLNIARAYLAEHPREVGGQNRGPWVRLFTGGLDGPAFAWCGYFVRFLLRQAQHPLAWRVSPSCDVTAANFSGAGRLGDTPESGGLFLVRGAKPRDWTHMGIVDEVGDGWIATMEANTNDEGTREGYEACARTRGVVGLDFVRLAA